MGENKVAKIDFGGSWTDRESRDHSLMLYICAVLDINVDQLREAMAKINTKREREAFNEMMYQDMKARISRILKEL